MSKKKKSNALLLATTICVFAASTNKFTFIVLDLKLKGNKTNFPLSTPAQQSRAEKNLRARNCCIHMQ